jgi:hypothetical protein
MLFAEIIAKAKLARIEKVDTEGNRWLSEFKFRKERSLKKKFCLLSCTAYQGWKTFPAGGDLKIIRVLRHEVNRHPDFIVFQPEFQVISTCNLQMSHITCILLLRLVGAIETIIGYDRLTGSGEVHNLLGSLKLPRQ